MKGVSIPVQDKEVEIDDIDNLEHEKYQSLYRIRKNKILCSSLLYTIPFVLSSAFFIKLLKIIRESK